MHQYYSSHLPYYVKNSKQLLQCKMGIVIQLEHSGIIYAGETADDFRLVGGLGSWCWIIACCCLVLSFSQPKELLPNNFSMMASNRFFETKPACIQSLMSPPTNCSNFQETDFSENNSLHVILINWNWLWQCKTIKYFCCYFIQFYCWSWIWVLIQCHLHKFTSLQDEW